MARWYDPLRDKEYEVFKSPDGEVTLRASDGNLVYANSTELEFGIVADSDEMRVDEVSLRLEIVRSQILRFTKAGDITMEPSELIRYPAHDPITVVFAGGQRLVNTANLLLEEFGKLQLVAETTGENGFPLFFDVEKFENTDFRQTPPVAP